MGTCYKCLHFDLYQIFFLFIMTLRIYGIQKATGSRAPHVTAVVQTQAIKKKKKRKITRNDLENLPSSFTDINDVIFF